MSAAKDTERVAIAEQAAEWYLRNREGPLDDDAKEAFQTWLSASPMHIRDYLGVARLIALIPEAGRDPELNIEALVRRAKSDTVVDFDGGAPMSATPTRRAYPKRGFDWRIGLVAASVLILAVGLIGRNWWDARVSSFAYATEHGVVTTFALPDHSVLQLDADSRVTVHYGRTIRQVELLRGQAYLEVTPDRVRPFEVLVGAVHIRDVGTHFDVRRRNALAEVTVVEGAVSVESAARSLIARAGQQASSPLDGGAITLRNVNPDEATAWRSGRLIFRQRPLLEVVDEFNRYSPVRIEVDSPVLVDMPVSGVMSTQDVTSFMAFLNNLPGVKVTAASGHISVTHED